MKRMYIRDKNNHKVGVLVAILDEEEQNVRIGFSKCNTKLDSFDRDLGLHIASARARKNSDRLLTKYNVPFKVQEYLPQFLYSCGKYYKDKKFPHWVRDIL